MFNFVANSVKMGGKFQFHSDSGISHGSLELVMGTYFDIVMVGKERSVTESVWYEISNELTRLERMLNRFDEKSDISKINKTAFQEDVPVNGEMWNILQDCKDLNKKTLGLFDVTLSDFSKVELIEKTKSVRFHSGSLHLDFGGFAKGYALKKIGVILKNTGINQAFVNFGNSSIMGIGHHPFGDSWKVGINNPFKIGTVADEIDLKDMAMSTSGNTPAYSRHIKNPKSGDFSEAFKLVSVKAKDPLVAEILSTVLMIADGDEKEVILRNFEIEDTKTYNF